RYDGGRLAQALAAGWDALGLADAADIGRDAARAARVPAQSDLLKKLDGGMTARIPALEEQRFVGIQDAPSVVAPVLPPGPRRHLQIALDGAPAAAHLGGGGRALASALGIGARPVPRDHLDPGMLPEPLGQRLSGAIRQQGHGLAALQIDQDGLPGASGGKYTVG